MHDAIQFEAAGVPATLVMTAPFQGLAARFAVTLGAPGYPAVIVPHPIATKSESYLDRLAREAEEDLVARLVG